MVTNKTYEYGIKYRVRKFKDDAFLLVPISLEGGLSDGIEFCAEREGSISVFPICNTVSDLKKKFVMDNVYQTAELEELFDYYEDTDVLAKQFYDQYKRTLIYVEIDRENDRLKKYYLDLDKFTEKEYDCTYHMDRKTPAVTLNEAALNELLQSNDIKEARFMLNKYQRILDDAKVVPVMGTADGIPTNAAKKTKVERPAKRVTTKKEPVPFGGVDVSYVGLRDAIRERVFGHDEEVATIAQKLYMNYTAVDGESVKSILIVGPSGTGKTETVEAASEYLWVPYFKENAANLVPQGYKGTSIEDVVMGLVEDAQGDVVRAQKGLVFLDEFDKLPDSELDLKKLIKHILLTFNEGGKVTVRNEYYNFVFDSRLTSKMYAGVFERLYSKNKVMGFGSSSQEEIVKLGDEDEIRRKIVDEKYYTWEDISRIKTIVGYNQLTRDTKKQILLFAKTSELAEKRKRYKRQFGIDIDVSDDYVDAILDSISNGVEGMRNVNNFVERTIDAAEKSILENERKGYKKLILTKNTVLDPKKFDVL